MTIRKAILTGLNGTVAPVLAERLRVDGVEVAGWDRQAVPVDDTRRGEDYVESVAPDLIVHLAMGAPDWAGHLAALSARRGIRFVYVSSVSVFDGSRPGPFPPDKEPDATDDYGRYKAECERRVRAENPNAYIARIGWQIGQRPGGNHMVDYLYRQQQEQGRVAASDAWTPSCSFLEDTADGLWRVLNGYPPATYNLEGNDGCSFFEIVNGLNRRLDAGWKVEVTDHPAVDIRMADHRIQLAPVRARLG